MKTENWIKKIIDWAEENNIPDQTWIAMDLYKAGGYWSGIPRDINRLLNLEELYLENLDIDSIPSEIVKLSNLKIIFIENTEINILISEIGKCQNLTNLVLVGCPIYKLPEEIGMLSNLKKLIIHNNNLVSLPKKIINLKKLKKLYIYNNPNLILTSEQVEWINGLEDNGCQVQKDNDVFQRSESLGRLYELLQNKGLKDQVASTIALGYMASHPDVIEAYNLVMNLAMTRGESPLDLLYGLDP